MPGALCKMLPYPRYHSFVPFARYAWALNECYRGYCNILHKAPGMGHECYRKWDMLSHLRYVIAFTICYRKCITPSRLNLTLYNLIWKFLQFSCLLKLQFSQLIYSVQFQLIILGFYSSITDKASLPQVIICHILETYPTPISDEMICERCLILQKVNFVYILVQGN